MVSLSMAVQDHRGSTRSSDVIQAGNNGISLTAHLHSLSVVHLNDQLLSNRHNISPKVRKPYTISKQREKWMEDEHHKFLEALKLYGRAWRRIEEHVGTKTAVQIRSHAQKFFSKIVRNSDCDNPSTVECFEIPPPRPKRKPLHPYPRKSGHHFIAEQTMPLSPNLSGYEQDNQSPMSVLSTIGSDTVGSTDSSTPNGESSPVSSGLPPEGFVHSESKSLAEESESPILALETVSSIPEETLLTKLELFPYENLQMREVSAKETPTQSLKLFGRIVPIVDSPRNTECSWSYKPRQVAGAFHFMQLHDGYSNSPTATLPFVPFHVLDNLELTNKEAQKEGSWTGSNTGSVDDGENDDDQCIKKDIETQSHKVKGMCDFKSRSRNRTEGFVPYKRCFAERDMVAAGEREEKRVHLCL